jgi:dimethylhistidine N-methyltransferase
MLEESALALVDHFPALRITGYAADYRDALATLYGRIDRPKLVIFLGSSLGNYDPGPAADLLRDIARGLGPDDRLLLGTDLAKDRATLEAAYDDSVGVTAAFNRNILVRINRELGSDFNPMLFGHRARYRPELGRVEMHLVSEREQHVRVPACSLIARFSAGETIHTENSHKYTTAMLADLAAQSGFEEEFAWIDPRGFFRVQRWRAVAGTRRASA